MNGGGDRKSWLIVSMLVIFFPFLFVFHPVIEQAA